jgi:hypothetical protein
METRRTGLTAQCNVEKDDRLTLAGLGSRNWIRCHVVSQSENGVDLISSWLCCLAKVASLKAGE